MQSPIYQEWVKEERAEAEAGGEARGKAEGRIEAKQDAICKFLSRRFGASQNEMMQKVKQMTDLEILDNVMEELFVANTMEEVQGIIQDGIKRSLQ